MQFSKIASIIAFTLAASAMASPVGEPDAVPDAGPAPELERRTEPALEGYSELAKRGFGCPFNRNECNAHCITLKGGRTGGYCAGTFRTTCTCVFG